MIKRSRCIVLVLVISCFKIAFIDAQLKADFENISLESESFLNGSNGENGFSSANVFLNNSYDFNYDFWSGWAISNITDNLTPGFTNQYSAIVGTGAETSRNYAVTYAFDPVHIVLENEAAGQIVESLAVTNSSYSFYSIRDGDSFAKKFGGATGEDPDYFLLTIRKYLDGELSSDSIDFYLADYRFSNSTDDYIIDEWAYIDLKPLGAADSLQLSLSSSDNGIFGMNTPAYICVDDIVTDGIISSNTELGISTENIIYPNPAKDILHIEQLDYFQELYIVDCFSRTVIRNITSSPIDLSGLAAGQYYLIGKSDELKISQRIIKN